MPCPHVQEGSQSVRTCCQRWPSSLQCRGTWTLTKATHTLENALKLIEATFVGIVVHPMNEFLIFNLSRFLCLDPLWSIWQPPATHIGSLGNAG